MVWDYFIPESKEVRRCLSFYDIFSWNVMTFFRRCYVIYTKADSEERTDEFGVSILLYLQTLFRTDWNNFLERLSIDDEKKIDPKQISKKRVLG